MYAAAKFELFQFDLAANPIASSKILIDSLDLTETSPTLFMDSKLAPDGKIYITGITGGNKLHVINNPDLQGLSCDLRQHSLILPTIDGVTVRANSFPNIPFFGNAPDNSVCDSLLMISSNREIEQYPVDIQLFPNPVAEILQIDFDYPVILEDMVVTDVAGRVLSEATSRVDLHTKKLDVSGMDNGIYYLTLVTREGLVTRRFVISR